MPNHPTYEELKKKAAEYAETKKELLLTKNIIMSSSSVIATSDLDGFMTYGNPAFLKTWGFDDINEIMGRHFSEFWMVKNLYEEIIQRLRNQGEWFGELKAKRKNGELFDVQISAATVLDQSGNPIGLTSTSIDITERNRIEEELRKSEIKHKTLVKNIPGMVYRAYPDWSAEVISGSKAICGYTEAELNSKEENWLSVVHPDDKERVLKAGFDLTLVQKDIIQQYRIETKDGETRWIEDRKTSLFSDMGEFIGIDGIVFDITARKAMEEDLLRERDKLREALAKIKTLSGMLPICSSCKKIRDDKGYWNQIESYIRQHSEAEFSHSICPECAGKLYAEFGFNGES